MRRRNLYATIALIAGIYGIYFGMFSQQGLHFREGTSATSPSEFHDQVNSTELRVYANVSNTKASAPANTAPPECQQRIRTQHLDWTCRRFPSSGNVTVYRKGTRTFESLIVVKKFKLLYCEVNKAGCTMMRDLILSATERGRKYLDDIGRNKIKLHAPHKVKPLGIRAHPVWKRAYDRYLKFIIVRHPFARLISAYRNMIVRDINNKHMPGPFIEVRTHIMESYLKKSGLQKVSMFPFSYFLEYITNKKSRYYSDTHWTPITESCRICSFRYTRILRIETLKSDIQPILTRLGLKNTVVENPVHSLTSKYSRTSLDMYKAVPERTINSLKRRYKKDMDVFGYVFEDASLRCEIKKQKCC